MTIEITCLSVVLRCLHISSLQIDFMAFTASTFILIGSLTCRSRFVILSCMAALDNETDFKWEKNYLSHPSSARRCQKTTAATLSPALMRITAHLRVRSTTAVPPTAPIKITGPTATWREPSIPTNTDWADISGATPHTPSINLCVCVCVCLSAVECMETWKSSGTGSSLKIYVDAVLLSIWFFNLHSFSPHQYVCITLQSVSYQSTSVGTTHSLFSQWMKAFHFIVQACYVSSSLAYWGCFSSVVSFYVIYFL